MSKIECPKCKSTNINQYRMTTGPIWCEACGFRAEEKEKNNPFVTKEEAMTESMVNHNCTCSFRIDRQRGDIDCNIVDDNGCCIPCHPDTCTLWQDHLRIEALVAVAGLTIDKVTETAKATNGVTETLNQLANRQLHDMCPVCGVDKHVCGHMKIGE